MSKYIYKKLRHLFTKKLYFGFYQTFKHTHTYTYTHIYTYIHTYTHIHTDTHNILKPF